MNSYVEVNLICSTLISVSAHLLANNFRKSKQNKHKIILISIIYNLLGLVCYNSLKAVILIHIWMCITLYQYQIKALLEAHFVILFWLTIAVYFLDATVVNMVLFIPSTSIMWVGFVLVLLVSILLIENVLKSLVFQQKFEMDIELEINGKTYQCHGYLDSGNTLLFNELPVIFLSDTIGVDLFGLESYPVEYQTIEQSMICLVYLCKIRFEGNEKEAYFGIIKDFGNHIDCLLNVALFH